MASVSIQEICTQKGLTVNIWFGTSLDMVHVGVVCLGTIPFGIGIFVQPLTTFCLATGSEDSFGLAPVLEGPVVSKLWVSTIVV